MNDKDNGNGRKLFDVAIRLAALLVPVLMVVAGWLINTASGHEARISVMEETRVVLLNQVLGDLDEIKESVLRIEQRLLVLERKP